MSESTDRELDKLNLDAEQRVNDSLFREGSLREQLTAANNRINELSALLYQILEQVENDLFNENMSIIQRQNLVRIIRQRILLTSEILEIVNKSRQQPEQTVNT